MTEQPQERRSERQSHQITLQQLHEDTAGVIDLVNSTRTPAFITHYGRFKGILLPLNDREVIEKVLTQGPIADELRHRAEKADDEDTMTSEEVLRFLEEKESRENDSPT